MLYGARVAMVLGLVVLAGCTEKAQQSPTLGPLAPSPSASPSPSPSAVASGPARPVGTDVQQIAALARDYYEETNRAVRTGDTARLRSLATGSCRCNAIAANIERVWTAGGIICPKYFNVHQIALPKATSPTAGFATAIYTINKAIYLNKAGQPIKTFPADPRPTSSVMDFTRVDGAWKVSLVSNNPR